MDHAQAVQRRGQAIDSTASWAATLAGPLLRMLLCLLGHMSMQQTVMSFSPECDHERPLSALQTGLPLRLDPFLPLCHLSVLSPSPLG